MILTACVQPLWTEARQVNANSDTDHKVETRQINQLCNVSAWVAQMQLQQMKHNHFPATRHICHPKKFHF